MNKENEKLIAAHRAECSEKYRIEVTYARKNAGMKKELKDAIIAGLVEEDVNEFTANLGRENFLAALGAHQDAVIPAERMLVY